MKNAGRAASLSLGGALCLSVGAGFLTVAAWITLEALLDAQMAALIIGCVYAGAGLIFLALAGRAPAEHRTAPTPQTHPRDCPTPAQVGTAELIAAALKGLSDGAAAGRAKADKR